MIRKNLQTYFSLRAAAILACLVFLIFSSAKAISQDVMLLSADTQSIDLTNKLHPLASARTKLTLDVIGSDPAVKDHIDLVASQPRTETTWYLVTLQNDSKIARNLVLSLQDSSVTSVYASGVLGNLKDPEGDTVVFKLAPLAIITLALESATVPKNVLLQDKTESDLASSGLSSVHVVAVLVFIVFAFIAYFHRDASQGSQNPLDAFVADQKLIERVRRHVMRKRKAGAEKSDRQSPTAEASDFSVVKNRVDDDLSLSTSHDIDDPYRSIRQDLHRAFELRQFDAYFQPIFRLNDRNIEGVEAAIQWHHPFHGIIAWPYIVSVAADDPMLEELDQLLMEAAINQVGAWNRQNPTRQPLNLVVNMGGLGADETTYCENLANLTLRNGIPRSTVTIQVQCASLGYYHDTARKFASQIKSSGYNFAGGNFGWGGADLSMLRTFAFDRLSLDASFFEWGASERHANTFLKATVAYLRSLGSKIVTTGILDETALRNANRLGLEHGQGYPHLNWLTTENLFEFLNNNVRNRFEPTSLTGHIIQSSFQNTSANGFKLGQTPI